MHLKNNKLKPCCLKCLVITELYLFVIIVSQFVLLLCQNSTASLKVLFTQTMFCWCWQINDVQDLSHLIDYDSVIAIITILCGCRLTRSIAAVMQEIWFHNNLASTSKQCISVVILKAKLFFLSSVFCLQFFSCTSMDAKQDSLWLHQIRIKWCQAQSCCEVAVAAYTMGDG